jgi:dienelactone hydrolase
MLWVVILYLATVTSLGAQARETVAGLRTRYNTVKTQAKPQGDLKAKFDAIDEQLLRAAKLGRTGELRRLYSQGIALAAGQPWTPEREFAGSLALRTERVFISPENPVAFRLEQIYAPQIELANPLTIRVSVNRPAPAGTGAPAQLLKDGGSFSNIGRDFIDEPFRFDLDLSTIADTRAVVRAEVLDGTRTLGAASLTIELRRGLADRLHVLEAGTTQVKGFDALRAEVLYPIDYIRNVDRGRISIGQFDVEKELSKAESALDSFKRGTDPFAAKTGDLKRHYLFNEANEIMPYRIYVPSTYTANRTFPLIIALHGNGGTEDTFFDGFDKVMPKLAEEFGYIVAAPLGYRVDGRYGANDGSRPTEELQKIELSEKDVMHVLDLMKQNYKIDPNRIYLAGHSMGGSGTWYLGPRYSNIWAALAPFAGRGEPSTMTQMKHLPQFVVHGDADATVPVDQSRSMVAEMKKLGVTHQYIEVPGGTHGGVVAPNLRAMFEFFGRYRKLQSN